MKNKVISLFSGAGGLDIGLEQAGFDTVVCIEHDKDCRETLRFNRPDWALVESDNLIHDGILLKRQPGDIRSISVEECLEIGNLKKGEAALVVGGAPCQPFSNIGKKLGINDEKNGDLFLEFVRFVRDSDPEGFIFENVTGITQTKHNEVIDYMLNHFKGLGYKITYGILNSADYGVPQKRRRFFMIGSKSSDVSLPTPTHFKDESTYQEYCNALGDSHKPTFNKWVSVQTAFSQLPKNYKNRVDFAVMNISKEVKRRMELIPQGKNFKVLPDELRPNCWKSGRHQGNDTFGRMIAENPSHTIRTAAYNPAKGMYIHPFENRGLDLIELATLQGFPIDWHFKLHGKSKMTLVSGGKQIGNAVPALLSKSIGMQLAKVINS